jgi:hypothetical protein
MKNIIALSPKSFIDPNLQSGPTGPFSIHTSANINHRRPPNTSIYQNIKALTLLLLPNPTLEIKNRPVASEKE